MMYVLANIWGFIYSHWRTVASVVGVIVITVCVLIAVKSCGKKTPKLNEQEIVAAQQAIAVEDRKTMQDILVKSDIRVDAIDGNVSNSKAATVNAIADSKAKWQNATNEEMAQELERRAKE